MLRKLLDLTILLIFLTTIIALQHRQQFTNQTHTALATSNETPQYLSLPLQVIPNTPLPTIIDHGKRTEKQIALTFDADMTPGMKQLLVSGQVSSWYNQKVIDILRQTHTEATLFLTGMWIETYPDITRQLAADPLFELANHSYDHPSFGGSCYGLSAIPLSKNIEEIEKTQTLLKQVAGVTNQYFRFPGGCYTQENVKLVKQLGLHIVNWDAIGGDSYLKNAKDIVNQTLSHVQDGSIIVLHMHDPEERIAGDTAGALPAIISNLKAQGYTFVTIAKLVEEHPDKQVSQVFPTLSPNQASVFERQTSSGYLFHQVL